MEQQPSNPKAAQDVDRLVGANIAALRRGKSMSQGALAHACGVSFQQIQKYEAGRNRVGAARLRTIAAELGVPVAVLFSDPDAEDDQGVALRFLQDPEVTELLRAFGSIVDVGARRSALKALQALAQAFVQAEGARA